MEINITSLLETDMFTFSHSIAESGDERAGKTTWNAALNGPRPLLNTPEEFDEFRDWVGGFGAWDEEEIKGWSENECQALLLQVIAGDVRGCPAKLEAVAIEQREDGFYYQTEDDEEKGLESGPFDSYAEAYRAASDEVVGFNQYRRADYLEDIDWTEYEAQANAGRIQGRLSRSEDGQVYFSVGD